MPNDKLQGEGNYEAAREYDEGATKFAKDRQLHALSLSARMKF